MTPNFRDALAEVNWYLASVAFQASTGMTPSEAAAPIARIPTADIAFRQYLNAIKNFYLLAIRRTENGHLVMLDKLSPATRQWLDEFQPIAEQWDDQVAATREEITRNIPRAVALGYLRREDVPDGVGIVWFPILVVLAVVMLCSAAVIIPTAKYVATVEDQRSRNAARELAQVTENELAREQGRTPVIVDDPAPSITETVEKGLSVMSLLAILGVGVFALSKFGKGRR